MKGLHTDELKEGTVYKCLLSGRNVLITAVIPKSFKGPDGVVEYKDIQAKSYNEVTGYYDETVVWDHMLTELIK